ncbi:MAG: DNA alkylation repair protein [Lachnospiraceae bacterium]|nr:DNA alkylation repair protein [Lachnospiraceae bacterium]MCD8249114.1 DNA alkylation repair protein [Lachnospiraceae bacterium]
MTIVEYLCSRQDTGYQDFQRKLMPAVPPESVIGVRTPILRSYVKEIKNTECARQFMQELPHTYFEENQLHALLVCEERSFDACLEKLQAFLPFVDNWATCDQLVPRVFRQHHQELLPYIDQWLTSGHVYTLRFGIGMLMWHFLDEDFDGKYPERVAAIRSGEYYVNMMIAWYFATALAKQYDAVLPYIAEKRLDPWVHRMTIRKARESFRVTEEHKEFLLRLR